jgi:hypothetical protein
MTSVKRSIAPLIVRQRYASDLLDSSNDPLFLSQLMTNPHTDMADIHIINTNAIYDMEYYKEAYI